ncbi:MAG: SufD family Fe-S cluster assembly protein, partial [Pseudomonadota bacterium]
MALPQPKVDGAEALLSRDEAQATPAPAAWEAEIRADAAVRLRAVGGPVRRDEYWRYTDPAPFMADTADMGAAQTGEHADFSAHTGLHFGFTDGVLDQPSGAQAAVDGLETSSLAEALAEDDHWSKDLFAQLEMDGQNPVSRPLAIYNTARATEGLALRATAPVESPVIVTYRAQDSSDADHLTRHVVRVEAGASLTVLEAGPASARCFQTMEVEVAPGGSFHHVRLQGPEESGVFNTHLFARLGEGSEFKSFTLAANGTMTRNECVIWFTGDDAQATVAGAALGRGKGFHHDDTVFVTHDAVNCESRQVFKKVL